jgi:hypothetical protein
MSYFTGPNEISLVPLRTQVATQSRVIADADLQALVSREIRWVILRHPDQKQSLLSAYRDASPEGKQFIEATLRNLDNELLDTIRAGAARR